MSLDIFGSKQKSKGDAADCSCQHSCCFDRKSRNCTWRAWSYCFFYFCSGGKQDMEETWSCSKKWSLLISPDGFAFFFFFSAVQSRPLCKLLCVHLEFGVRAVPQQSYIDLEWHSSRAHTSAQAQQSPEETSIDFFHQVLWIIFWEIKQNVNKYPISVIKVGKKDLIRTKLNLGLPWVMSRFCLVRLTS